MATSMLSCSNRSGRDKVRFFRLPAVIKHQGTQMLQISTERRHAWLRAINREYLTKSKLANIVVCERHFIKGTHDQCLTLSLYIVVL